MPGPNWLSQDELDSLRAQQVDIISEIGGFGEIKRPTRTKDGYGGYTETFSVQSNVPMRLWISSGPNGTSSEARFRGEQEINETDAFVTVAWNTDIKPGDVVTYDNRDWHVVGTQYKDTLWTAIRARVVSIRARTS